MNLYLSGKVILVTGGSAGLGFSLAELLVAEGAKVAIGGRDASRLAEAAGSLGSETNVIAIGGDMRDPETSERFVSSALRAWGRVDGVVNNAGELSAGSFSEHDDDVWHRDLELKLMAAVRMVRAALPALRRHSGAVVNTLSVTGKAPDELTTPTSVSRAAGMALTKALSREFAHEGIRVNAVLVGAVASPQLARNAAAAGTTTEEYHARLVDDLRIPMGRVGQPNEYADLVAFLLSARASYLTGAAINLDGGLSPVV